MVFSNPRQASVPGLLGVTAVLSRGSLKPASDSAARAAALFQQAKAAAGANRLQESLSMLRNALNDDPTLGDA